MSARTAPAFAGRGDGRPLVPPAEPRSYYGRGVIKEPVWKSEIPWYFFCGGLAGAAAPLAAGARLVGNDPLARRAAALAVAGAAVSPALLISDLGRPARFLNMLRVFKPTSPMSVGSWVLSAFGTSSGIAAGWQLAGIPGAAVGAPAQALAALLGPALSTYTAVLIANTAVPVWHESRHTLPFVFAGSSLASAGAACAALTPAPRAAPARAVAVAGALLETGAGLVMQRRLEPVVRASYTEPGVRRLVRAARAATVAGALALAASDRKPAVALGAGGLLCGAVLERWAVFKAGFASAADARQSVGPQRARIAAR
jgi:hypothetical protein